MLVDGLPPEAAVWRDDSPFEITDAGTLLALLIERMELWGRANALHTGVQLKGFRAKGLPDPLDLRPRRVAPAREINPFDPVAMQQLMEGR